MNFQIFSMILRREYSELGDFYPYSCEDCMRVFQRYFTAFAMNTCQEHPPLRGEQIRSIMEKMPYLELDRGSAGEPEYVFLTPEDYFVLIDRYFKTPFPRCDRNINHFFSGNIRALRYFEEVNL